VGILDPELAEHIAELLRGPRRLTEGNLWESILEYTMTRSSITENELQDRRVLFNERLAALRLAHGATAERRHAVLDASPPAAGRMRVGSASRESSSLSDGVSEEGRGFLGTHAL
jgi:hypothetical protein